jgi:hypothetical protein
LLHLAGHQGRAAADPAFPTSVQGSGGRNGRRLRFAQVTENEAVSLDDPADLDVYG